MNLLTVPSAEQKRLLNSQNLESLATVSCKASRFFEKHGWTIFGLFIAVAFSTQAAMALHKKMWLDELYTYYVSQQGSATQIVKAIAEGCDNQPPLYAFLVSILSKFLGPGELAVRLPSLIGFCSTMVFVFTFARRRFPTAYAILAALLVTRVCLHFATEGRSYGLVLCFTSGALLAWQVSSESHKRLATLLVATCLALATAFHYLAMFQGLPLLVGEIARRCKGCNVRWTLLLALLAPLTVLAIHWPLIEASEPFTKHFWSPASWNPHLIGGTYKLAAGYLVLFLVPTLLMTWLLRLDQRGRPEGSKAGLKAYELAAMVATFVAPIVVLTFAIVITHIFVDRYVLWTAPGLSILATEVLFRSSKGRPVPAFLLISFVLPTLVVPSLKELASDAKLKYGEAVSRAIADVPPTPAAIVIGDPRIYMELSYYAVPKLRDRIVYLADKRLELLYEGEDTNSLLLAALGKRNCIHVAELDRFISGHGQFILATGPLDWCLATSPKTVIEWPRLEESPNPLSSWSISRLKPISLRLVESRRARL